MSELDLEGLSVQRSGTTVVDGVALKLHAGEFVGLLGPNGAGKTTLMRAAQGLLAFKGTSSLAALPTRDRARHVSWMPQTREINWPITVRTLVALGRTPHLAAGRKLTCDDHAAVDAAIERMDLDMLADRPATALSGGEQARALIARVLAQGSPLIFADEPIAGLDPAHQIATMRIFRSLASEGRSLLVSLHELGLAAKYCTRLLLMHKGRIVADGRPRSVLNENRVRDVFHVDSYWSEGPVGPAFHVLDESVP